MPIMPKDQGCFCCKPTLQSDACSQEITGQQFQENSVITALPISFPETNHSFTSHNITIDVGEPPWQQDGSLNINSSQQRSQLEWNSLLENTMPSQVIHKFEMFHIQDSHRMIANKSTVTPEPGEHSSHFNFHILRNRELGGRIAGNMVSEMNPLLSSSNLSSCNSDNGSIPNNDCDNTFVTIASANSSDSMDLDSALDELGMLSSVTNVRRQYLLDTRNLGSFMKRDKRLHSKSESSPNLSTLSHPNGYHIVQMNSNFVSSLSGASMLSQASSLCEKSFMSGSSQWKYRNPNMHEEATRHQRSVPRMSRMRKDRYMYRRSRCPYKIPNRLFNAMQESSSRPEYFTAYTSPFATSPSLSDNGIDTAYGRLTNCKQLSESKSDTASPTKSHIEVSLVRSLSAEDLAPIHRRLERELNKEYKAGCETEQNLDSMTSQMTHLQMS